MIILKKEDNGRYKLYTQSEAGTNAVGSRLHKGKHGEGWPWPGNPPKDYEDPREAWQDLERLNDYIEACSRHAFKRPRKRSRARKV